MRWTFFFDPRPANDNAVALDELEALPRGTPAVATDASVHWLRARRCADGAHVLMLVRGGFGSPEQPANDDSAPIPPGVA